MQLFNCTLKLNMKILAEDPREAIHKFDHIINELGEDGFKDKIVVEEV